METNRNENSNPNSTGCCKSSPKREIHNDTSLLQEIRKISNTHPNLTPKATRKKKSKQNPKLIQGKKSQWAEIESKKKKKNRKAQWH